jgi:hypothetical protein
VRLVRLDRLEINAKGNQPKDVEGKGVEEILKIKRQARLDT